MKPMNSSKIKINSKISWQISSCQTYTKLALLEWFGKLVTRVQWDNVL